MGRVSHYNPKEVSIVAAGAQIEGFADGEYITIEQMSDAFSTVVGSDGEVARSKSNDRRVKVTIKLLQTSLSNDVLSAVHLLDLNAENGAGVFFFQMLDLSGTSIVHASQAWIVKLPDQSMDRTVKSREWVIECATGERFVGGNPSP